MAALLLLEFVTVAYAFDIDPDAPYYVSYSACHRAGLAGFCVGHTLRKPASTRSLVSKPGTHVRRGQGDLPPDACGACRRTTVPVRDVLQRGGFVWIRR